MSFVSISPQYLDAYHSYQRRTLPAKFGFPPCRWISKTTSTFFSTEIKYNFRCNSFFVYIKDRDFNHGQFPNISQECLQKRMIITGVSAFKPRTFFRGVLMHFCKIYILYHIHWCILFGFWNCFRIFPQKIF